jgi:4-aminobutyrate aminotransferase-like enzyme
MMPKVKPNQALIQGIETMLTRARAGLITDGVMVGVGYTGDGRQDWFHHYSIEREDDMVTMIGELDLFRDGMKVAVHNTRNRAASIAKVKGVSGVS